MKKIILSLVVLAVGSASAQDLRDLVGYYANSANTGSCPVSLNIEYYGTTNTLRITYHEGETEDYAVGVGAYTEGDLKVEATYNMNQMKVITSAKNFWGKYKVIETTLLHKRDLSPFLRQQRLSLSKTDRRGELTMFCTYSKYD